ncbi:uncharacterized protein DS421_15g502470 [Arachis hypogaea]|nr:uncharacterized protein DS421_15g502470 [Arachis hypogaea]
MSEHCRRRQPTAATDKHASLSLHLSFSVTSPFHPPLQTLASVAVAALLTTDERRFLHRHLHHPPPGPASSLSTRSRGRVSTKFLGTIQSLPSTLPTPSTPMTSQAGPSDQQFYHGPNLNYVSPSVTPFADPVIKPAVGDSSSTPQQDAFPPPPIIRMRIWPDDMQP